MSADWLPYAKDAGLVIVVVFMIRYLVGAVDKNTRVLYRIEGFLQGQAQDRGTPQTHHRKVGP